MFGKNKTTGIVTGINNKIVNIVLEPDTDFFVCIPYLPIPLKGLDVDRRDLVDCGIMPISDVVPQSERLLSMLSYAGSFEERVKIITAFSNEILLDPDYSFSVSEFMALQMCVSLGSRKISDVCFETGYSERYCRKRFSLEYGLTPKKYCEIMRIQRVMNEMCNPTIYPLSYGLNAYYDQSHFIRDFKTLTNITPGEFKKQYV